MFAVKRAVLDSSMEHEGTVTLMQSSTLVIVCSTVQEVMWHFDKAKWHVHGMKVSGIKIVLVPAAWFAVQPDSTNIKEQHEYRMIGTSHMSAWRSKDR